MRQIFIGSIQQDNLEQKRKNVVLPPHIAQFVIIVLLLAVPIGFHNMIFKLASGFSNVVLVTTYSGTGSAIYIGGDRLLTAAHVVEGMQLNDVCEIEFQNPNDPSMSIYAEADLMAKGDYSIQLNNVDQDYALLHIRYIDASKYATACGLANSSNAKVGETVKVEGYPAGVYSLTPGSINNVSGGILDDKSIFVVSAKAWHGNSGGALKNENDQLLGIVTNIGTLKGYNDDQTLVLKIDDVKESLNAKGYNL